MYDFCSVISSHLFSSTCSCRCKFIPNQGVDCSGGLSDDVFDDGSRRLLDMAQEMDETFITNDTAGYLRNPAHQFLESACTVSLVKPKCDGGCKRALLLSTEAHSTPLSML